MTVTTALPDTPPAIAVTTALPSARVSTNPVSSTLATRVSLDAQVNSVTPATA